MAINKKLIHFKNFSDFNSKKLSANEENTQYTIGVEGTLTTGSPDILYQSICYIKDTKQQWTHGQLYDGSDQITESDITDMGFTKNTGTYSKPTNGIPLTDLTTDIQTSLSKADTALQSYTEQYTGTITGVSANGTSVATSGVANIPAATTGRYGVTKLSSSTSSTSTTLAATASAVKAAYDLANGKQSVISDLDTIRSGALAGATAVQPEALAAVATSGSYNDLTDTPTIPEITTESTVTGWGFTKNEGTITEVSINGTSIATTGTANIPIANTTTYGVTKLSSLTNSTNVTVAATSMAVKSVYDLANGKQDTLVSGTNIKTINGESILSSGDLTVVAEETDPIFSASPAATITTSNISQWNNKQVKLISGTNIKTINGTSLLGSGDITIEGGSDYTLPVATNLVLGGIKVAAGRVTETVTKITGGGTLGKFYGVEIDKTNTAFVHVPWEANVQSDWNETSTSSDAYILNKPTLSTVATSGSYNDLSNKPTIPSEVTESTVSGWGFTKNSGTYSKPSDGIPADDLNNTVQACLTLATTAVQTESDPVFTASAAAGITSDNITTWNNKQDALVSGTSIKTINGLPVLGSGDINLNPMAALATTGGTLTLAPNTTYVIKTPLSATTTIVVIPSTSTTYEATWSIRFKISTSTVPTISFAVNGTAYTILWANGTTPTFESGKAYEITFKQIDTIFLGVCGVFSEAS